MTRPPITRMVSPVTYDDASEARNTHASAMSSGRPSRPSGICSSCSGAPGGRWRCSGYHSAWRRSVSMKPGITMLARTPKGPSSAASARTRLPALGGHRVQLVPVDPRVEHEVGALGGEGQRDGAPDVAAGAGDERGLPLEPHPRVSSRPPVVLRQARELYGPAPRIATG